MMTRDPEHQITVVELRSFLRGQGWNRHVSEGQNWDVYTFQFPGMDDEARITLPLDTRGEDALQRRKIRVSVRSAIETIAGLFERDPDDVVAAIRQEDRDVLGIRFPVMDGTASLPLSEMTKQLENIKSLIAYATAALENPVPYHETWRGSMKQMTEHVRFGHTFSGSFGLSIESPLTQKPHALRGLFGNEEDAEAVVNPFEHRVMERVAKGIIQVAEAADDGGADRLVEEYKEGVNARMCESIAASLKRVTGGITYAFEWSSYVDVSSDIARTPEVRLSSKCVSILEEASKRLREREPEDAEVVGRVIQLASRAPSRLGSKKIIRVERTERKSGEPHTVIVDVGADAYKQAIRAHENGEFVRVKGRLTRSGNFWHLADVTNFEKWKPRGGK